MADETQAIELYRRYRPAKLSEVVGQDTVIQELTTMGKAGKLPHVMMFSGPSGTGKTTVARILRRLLKCQDIDYNEINSADCRGIDDIRGIIANMGAAPVASPCRIWLIDECQGLTPDAQNAFLKALEDTPQHVYFFLCTTDPKKIKAAMQTRCTEFKFVLVKEKNLVELVNRVATAEQVTLHPEVADLIATAAMGSPRRALVILHKVMRLPADQQTKAVESAGEDSTSFQVARLLMSKNTKWREIAELLENLQEEPETARRVILGYARTCLLRGGSPRAADIIDEFWKPYYDIGAPGLAANCYRIFNQGQVD